MNKKAMIAIIVLLSCTLTAMLIGMICIRIKEPRIPGSEEQSTAASTEAAEQGSSELKEEQTSESKEEKTSEQIEEKTELKSETEEMSTEELATEAETETEQKSSEKTKEQTTDSKKEDQTATSKKEKSTAAASKEWVKLYKDSIQKDMDEWGDYDENDEFDRVYAPSYALIYLDDDELPELVERHAKFTSCLRYYHDGKIHEEQLDTHFPNYIPRSGLLLDSEGYKGEGGDAVYCLKNGEWKMLGGGGWEYPYFEDPEMTEENTTYTWEGTKVSKKVYDENIDKLYNHFEGDVSIEFISHKEMQKKLSEFE